jgi:MOSC domain-containing protein YiiM
MTLPDKGKMQGEIIQINTSQGGMPKFPVLEAEVHRLGVGNDAHAHPNLHGGPDKAVLIITEEGLEELKCLSFPVYPGAMGENLTVRGLDRKQMRIGQVYQAGTSILEITRMRAPCAQLSVYGPGIQEAVYDLQVRAGDPQTPRWGLAGFYASVRQPGMVRPGDIIKLLEIHV